MPDSVSPVQSVARALQDNIGRVIVGKPITIELLLVALLSQGHVLLEDVPGLGKTPLAKALARSLGCAFQRLQFPPDPLPSDITGVSVFNQKTAEFEFRPGPIMAQIVLADEINRAGPRTQSALLEAMEERQATVDGVTRPLPRPFMVIATQNPIELEGTFPLPEAQLDRFLLRLSLGYPAGDEEREILRRFRTTDPLAELEPVVTGEDIVALSAACRQVHVSVPIESYILSLVRVAAVLMRSRLLLLLDMLLLLVAGASALWGRYCLAAVSYGRQFQTQRLFCGEQLELWIEIVNAKPLPLAWLKAEDEFPEDF